MQCIAERNHAIVSKRKYTSAMMILTFQAGEYMSKELAGREGALPALSVC